MEACAESQEKDGGDVDEAQRVSGEDSEAC